MNKKLKYFLVTFLGTAFIMVLWQANTKEVVNVTATVGWSLGAGIVGLVATKYVTNSKGNVDDSDDN